MGHTKPLLLSSLALLLTGCSLSSSGAGRAITPTASPLAPEAGSAKTVTPAAPGVGPSDGFAGLYLDAGSTLRSSGDSGTVFSSLPCPSLIDVLAAGQWAVTTQAKLLGSQPQDSSSQYLAALALGNRRAMAWLQGQGSCTAYLATFHSAQVQAQGVINASGESMAVALNCLSLPADKEGQGGSIVQMGYEGPGSFRAVTVFSVPNSQGSQPLSADEIEFFGLAETDIELIPLLIQERQVNPSLPPFGQEGLFLAALANDPEAQGKLPLNILAAYKPGNAFSGSVAVDSTQPLTGKVTLSGLTDAKGGTESLEAAFRCPTPAQ